MTISRIGIIGAGFMGSGIAESASSSGVEVTVYEPDAGRLDGSRRRLNESLERAVSRGRKSSEEANATAERIAYTTALSDLVSAEAVIEAASENASLKRQIFGDLDHNLPDATFLASNTSSIPIAELAACTQRPERVIGLHFFSPVPVMKLVEVVVALDTDPRVVSAAKEFAIQIGKHPVRTKDRAGFLVNMLLVPYLTGAVRMYEDGFASRDDIDEGMRLGCGHPMGPLTLCDFIGLDVVQAICDSLFDEFKQAEYAAPPLLRRMVVSGHHGRKTGRGFYEYETPAPLTTG